MLKPRPNHVASAFSPGRPPAIESGLNLGVAERFPLPGPRKMPHKHYNGQWAREKPQDNIREGELRAFRLLASEMLGLEPMDLAAAAANGTY